ncbi:uncharacterized protein [Argopecten irradians]|uniref:uncharacterized protein n=1 Tax=Argopecten irradians TaxID=31199 RepID=UPI003715D385
MPPNNKNVIHIFLYFENYTKFISVLKTLASSGFGVLLKIKIAEEKEGKHRYTLLPSREHMIYSMSMAKKTCPIFCPKTCSKKHHPLLVALINTNAQENGEVSFKLLEATISRYIKIGKWTVLDAVADTDPCYRYPLIHWAACLGKVSVVKWLIERDEGSVFARHSPTDDTALHLLVNSLQKTCQKEANKVFKELVSVLSDCLICGNRYGDTPLHLVCRNLVQQKPKTEYFTECVSCILKVASSKAGAADFCATVVNIQNNEGNTPVHILAQKDHTLNVIKMIAEVVRPDLKLPNDKGKNVLQIAADHRQMKISAYLHKFRLTVSICKNVPAQPNPAAEQPNSVTEQPNSVTEQPNSVTEQPNSVTEQPNSVTEQPNSATEQPNSATDTEDTDFFTGINHSSSDYSKNYEVKKEVESPSISCKVTSTGDSLNDCSSSPVSSSTVEMSSCNEVQCSSSKLHISSVSPTDNSSEPVKKKLKVLLFKRGSIPANSMVFANGVKLPSISGVCGGNVPDNMERIIEESTDTDPSSNIKIEHDLDDYDEYSSNADSLSVTDKRSNSSRRTNSEATGTSSLVDYLRVCNTGQSAILQALDTDRTNYKNDIQECQRYIKAVEKEIHDSESEMKAKNDRLKEILQEVEQLQTQIFNLSKESMQNKQILQSLQKSKSDIKKKLQFCENAIKDLS